MTVPTLCTTSLNVSNWVILVWGSDITDCNMYDAVAVDLRVKLQEQHDSCCHMLQSSAYHRPRHNGSKLHNLYVGSFHTSYQRSGSQYLQVSWLTSLSRKDWMKYLPMHHGSLNRVMTHDNRGDSVGFAHHLFTKCICAAVQVLWFIQFLTNMDIVYVSNINGQFSSVLLT
jgi:hypothetical protein